MEKGKKGNFGKVAKKITENGKNRNFWKWEVLERWQKISQAKNT